VKINLFKAVMVFFATTAMSSPADVQKAYDLNKWVHESFEYVRSPYEIKSPYDTMLEGGDCADLSSLIVWLLGKAEIPAQVVVIDLVDHEEHHAFVVVWGWWFDPVSGRHGWGRYYREYHYSFSISGKEIAALWRDE
jgi:transglutaminase-like putative cysteine protease